MILNRLRNAHELLVIAHLAPICPFQLVSGQATNTEDQQFSWAECTVDKFKIRFPELWESMLSHQHQAVTAQVIVDVILREESRAHQAAR